MSKIEDVARAIAGNVLNRMQDGDARADIDRLWQAFVPAARAAIEAMREPSEGMFQAAAPFPEHLRHEHPDPDDRWHRLMEAATIADQMAARSTYQTMIAAALDENAR